MGRFDSIYLFTTENIAGYMSELDLNNKKVVINLTTFLLKEK